MKVETGTPWTGRVPQPAGNWDRLLGPARRFPRRLRERRFWHVQALVLGATAPHYIIETLGYTNPFETYHGLSISLYIVPLLYAALNFGWEGAVLTALWAAALTSPSMWIWHRSEYHWFTELGQLMVTLPVGILVAWRVDLEAKQRLRAEKTSASLSLLNEVGKVLSHTLEVEQQLPGVLQRLRNGLSLDSVWLCLESEQAGRAPRIIDDSSGEKKTWSSHLPQALHEQIVSTRAAAAIGQRAVAVPLLLDAGPLGSLGATSSANGALGQEQVELLTTVAHQVSVAIQNDRLYRERQESLRSYARQVTQAQEEERLRIARDLHDETAQELVGLVRSLEQLGNGASEPGLVRLIDQLLRQARGTLQSVRRYSRDLRPSVLDDLGLLAALEIVIEHTNGRLPGGAGLTVTGKPRRLGEAVELALFRIAQEALRNVEKHAGAESATVQLHFTEQEVRLKIADDGQGMEIPRDLSELAGMGKLGLLGMKERAELVEGSFELSSSPAQGTTLTVTVGQAQPHGRGRFQR